MSFDNGVFDICSIDENGGHLRKLTSGQGKNEDPCWSPDGRYIMFSSNRTGHYHIYIMTANGHNQIQITTMEGDQTSPSWAP
jgi:TolB protein